MRFKKGQKLVCVVKGNCEYTPPVIVTYLWGFLTRRFIHAPGPAYNEVVTCDGYMNFSHCFLEEYHKIGPNGKRQAWNENCFEPLVEEEVFEEAIKEVFENKSVKK